MTFTEQLVEAPDGLPKVHVPPGVKATVPVGAVAPEDEVSVTVAMHEAV